MVNNIINGKYTSAKVFTNDIEKYAEEQIKMLCDNEVFKDCKIRIMPDVHPGKVSTIGFTSTIGDKIMPNIVGVDIGCGITMAKLNIKNVEYSKLDVVIRDNIPSGFRLRGDYHILAEYFDLSRLYCYKNIDDHRVKLSIGTLGGGNHFIELDRDKDKKIYVTIHSGSRRLGIQVTDYYLNAGQRYLKSNGIDIPYELTYLEGELKDMYLHDIKIVQEFAALNRKAILYEITKGMKFKIDEVYECMHNYISDDYILRKGAISAKDGEKVIIPINMKDGIILGTGKGNPEYNYSAPHGAGRVLKRTEVKNNHTLSEYKKIMKGIYSSSINKNTLDEAPFAYRNINQILPFIEDTVDVTNILTPVYNFKAEGNDK